MIPACHGGLDHAQRAIDLLGQAAQDPVEAKWWPRSVLGDQEHPARLQTLKGHPKERFEIVLHRPEVTSRSGGGRRVDHNAAIAISMGHRIESSARLASHGLMATRIDAAITIEFEVPLESVQINRRQVDGHNLLRAGREECDAEGAGMREEIEPLSPFRRLDRHPISILALIDEEAVAGARDAPIRPARIDFETQPTFMDDESTLDTFMPVLGKQRKTARLPIHAIRDPP
jgi:hypothetical protein